LIVVAWKLNPSYFSKLIARSDDFFLLFILIEKKLYLYSINWPVEILHTVFTTLYDFDLIEKNLLRSLAQ
jgi:hypothetical protein